MIQKAIAMCNLWLAASSQQCALLCITSPAELFGETSNHPGNSDPYSPDLAPWDFWLFAKLKSPLKGKRFQMVHEIQENTWGSWPQLGELCEVSRCLLWRGLRHRGPMYNVSCFLYLLQYMSLLFPITWMDIFGTDFAYTYIMKTYVSISNRLFLDSPHIYTYITTYIIKITIWWYYVRIK